MENYEAITTQDPGEAFDLTLKHAPVLVILDIYMGPPSGLDVLAKLRRTPKTKSVPVIMLTGANKMDDVETAMNLGASAYIVKPCEPDRLCQKIASVLKPASASQ